ncbi:MAG: ABC transporter ATP-binding protein [Terriglobia bacterium]
MTPSIRLEKISKQYRIGAPGPSYLTLREAVMERLAAPLRRLTPGNRQPAPERHIWALDNVSFEIMPGEAVGIIGLNGAGKTTLLKILARITKPTSGRAELRGRVGSLLDVGTGFHAELTGRENIYLYGAILGMTRAEVRRKLDQIVDFCGVEPFLETPLKHYSAGMRVRLAFAVAAHLDTEILLADEVLAVGDAAFQKKCLETMGSLAQHGRTVLFVSHNMGAVGELCPQSILLEKGRVIGVGKTREIIQKYLADISPQAASVSIEPPVPDKGVALARITICDCAGRPAADLDWQFPFSISVEFRVTRRIPGLSVGITLKNQLGVRVLFSWATFQQAFDSGTYQAAGEFAGERFAPGRYSIEAYAQDYGIEMLHAVEQAASFEIAPSTVGYAYDFGDYALLYAGIPWKIHRVEGGDSAQPV